jgi:uncharacterized protein
MMRSVREFVDKSADDVAVRGFLHHPGTLAPEGLVLTHGAGSNCQSPLLLALAEAFCASGWMVLRCDLPFRQARPHGPPPRGKAECDQAGLRAAVKALRRETPGRIFFGGHSYGGRQASMLAAAEPGLAGALLLLSYPLHPPQRPDAMRTAHLPDLRTPALFVHGTADGFGSIAEMQKAIRLIPARTELLSIPGAGHELIGRRQRGEMAALVAKSFMRFAAR